MSGMITVLDRLLEAAGNNESEEHVIEQAHYAVDNVSQKFLARFETLVDEISSTLGQPQYNASTDSSDKESKNPMPKWVTGTRKGEAATRVMRLSYWKRDNGISYLILRQELDSKDRTTYYDLVLGGRRKTRVETHKMEKLRQADTSFMAWLKSFFNRSQV